MCSYYSRAFKGHARHAPLTGHGRQNNQMIYLFLLYRIATACSPFSMDQIGTLSGLGSMGVSSSSGSSSLGARARGQSTHLGGPDLQNGLGIALGSSSNPPITSADQLNCDEFDNTCRWRNMEGLFIDELDWFQGSGHLDQGRLQVATGTSMYPDGNYAIVATDTIQLPTSKAVLVSDQITCQNGPGILRFLYWTSPEVRLKICTKLAGRPYPEFSYCSPAIERGDPGPANVDIPDQGRVPFQLYIVADNFVFRAVNLQGGFAIIDGLEYEAVMCSGEAQIPQMHQNEIEPLTNNRDTPATLFPTLDVRQLQTDTTAMPASMKPLMSFNPTITRRGPASGPLPDTVLANLDRETGGMAPMTKSLTRMDGSAEIRRDMAGVNTESASNELAPVGGGGEIMLGSTKEASDPTAVISACEALTCSFNDSQPCVQFAADSKWGVAGRPIGNPLTGIRGDASQLPFNREGYFAFADGPRIFSRLATAPFYLDRHSLFVFSYHKVDKGSKFRLFAKKAGSTEEMQLFEAPRVSKDSRRWFREGRELTAGQYDYIAFEIRELAPNSYVGVDEWMIVDDARRAFCSMPQ